MILQLAVKRALGFPMFTLDGKRLVFASNRNGKVQGETNVFIADWME
jgi:TolB protein